jgi:mannose-6-phosphate isomerase-like protein (cupin superfamily)
MAIDHNIRRIITGHDSRGKAIVEVDSLAPNQKVRPGTGLVSTLIWATDETPAQMDLKIDRGDRTIGVPPPKNGTVFRVVDFPPIGENGVGMTQADILKEMGVKDTATEPARHAFMHRTASVDYAIVLSGEIDMLLDDSEVHMKAGDIMVQQGTNHAWVNNSNEFCRMAFVLVDAIDPLLKDSI